jgi:hypothetical protein
MDKRLAGLLGAAAALATVGSANAAGTPESTVDTATTYRDLLNPIANPVEALKADDARLAARPDAATQVAQVTIGVGHHHHHHHHHARAQVRVRVAPRPHHHHHHHHHSSYYGH